jgi:hypothetical protein
MGGSFMITVIQVINVEWTKKSRGAPGSVKRNSLPEEMLVMSKENHWSDNSILINKYFFSEFEHFKNPKTIVKIFHSKDYSSPPFSVIIEAGYAKLVYRKKIDYHIKEVTLEIQKNQWKRVRYNYMYSDFDTGEWNYVKEVVNVAFIEHFSSNIFISVKPSEEYADIKIYR